MAQVMRKACGGTVLMSKHINTYCDNCETQYNAIELCDCETEAINKINNFANEQIKQAKITGEVPF